MEGKGTLQALKYVETKKTIQMNVLYNMVNEGT